MKINKIERTVKKIKFVLTQSTSKCYSKLAHGVCRFLEKNVSVFLYQLIYLSVRDPLIVTEYPVRILLGLFHHFLYEGGVMTSLTLEHMVVYNSIQII